MGPPPHAAASSALAQPGQPSTSSTSNTVKDTSALVKQEPQPAAGPSHLRHELPFDQLNAELPNIAHDLVGLGFVVHRVVGQVYAQLEGLTDILPSKNDTERKQLLVSFVQEARKHLVRLLVIAKWSASAEDYKRAQDIVGFLQAQNGQIDGSTAELADLRDSLTNARVRNYDISTALDVLTTGTYDRVPAVIKAVYATPTRLPDEIVKATLNRLDDVIRLRLAIREDVPPAMRSYRVEDGRGYFTVAHLFEASLTVGGDAEEDRWFLLHTDFSPGDNINFSEVMRQRVIELANAELAPQESLDPAQPDKPLHRLYVFLRDLALDFRIERLHTEALKLASTSWKGNLSVAMQREERALSISYWTAITPPDSQTLKQPRQPPPPPPRVYISVAPRVKTAASLIAERVDEQVLEDFQLVSRWEPSGQYDRDSVIEPLADKTTIGDLLDSLVSKHLDVLTRQLFLQVREEADSQLAGSPLSPISEDDSLVGFTVALREAFDISVRIDRHTGKLSLRSNSEAATGLSRRIRTLATTANANRHALVQILGQVRALVIVHEVQAWTGLAGFRTHQPTSLRAEDRRKLGALPDSIVMVPLPQLDGYYVLAMASQHGLRFALALMRTPTDEDPAWCVMEMAWVKPAPTSPLQAISIEHVREVVRYCALRVTYLGLERQLTSRLVLYARHATKSTESPLGDLPLLAFRIEDVVPGASFAQRLVAVQAEFRSAAKPCRIVFYLRLIAVPPSLAMELPADCTLDASTRLLTARFLDNGENDGERPLSRFFALLGLLHRLSQARPSSGNVKSQG